MQAELAAIRAQHEAALAKQHEQMFVSKKKEDDYVKFSIFCVSFCSAAMRREQERQLAEMKLLGLFPIAFD